MADPVIFAEWTANPTRASVPLGAYYFQYSASFEDQGPVRVLCAGSTSVNSTNAHFVTGDVVGNVKIVLTDDDTGEVRTLIDGNTPTAGVTIIDGTHQYSLAMDSDGGHARVVCDKCGAVNHIYGSATMLFRALGTYDAKVRKHPESATVNEHEDVSFTIEGIHVKNYQWQIMRSDEGNYSDITTNNLGNGTTASGITTDTLSLHNVSSSLDGIKFRNKLTGLTDNVIITDSAKLNVNKAEEEPAYIGVNGYAKKITKRYIGVNGVAKSIIAGYIGVDNVAKKVL